MSECPSVTVRNVRKTFLKCVDCGCQTLPQNASKERPWTTAASLYIRGRVNDGALCFQCATERRKRLGLPVENTARDAVSSAPECQVVLKNVHINARKYSWTVGTLESLLAKWRDECLAPHFKNREINFWIVALNDEIIPATAFSSRPISEGDTILIAMGAVAGG